MPSENDKKKKPVTINNSRADAKREREKHFNNTRQVLWYSNATPIRSHGDGGYNCCYCIMKYPDPADLKEHTLLLHKDEDILNASFNMRINLNGYYVKLDITGLKCSLCNTDIDTLELLLEHISKVHKKKVHYDINNRMIPFKFTGGYQEQLTCFMCLNVFSSFKSLLEHMNNHYRNFICEVCDAGFVARSLAVNHTNTHRFGTFKCTYCPKVYNTKLKRMNHERVQHTKTDTVFRCGICDERFKYYNHKQKHLLELHGVALEAKCQACGRVFATQNKLQVHVKKQHLMYRKYHCTECDKDFFSKTELRDHSFKHSGLKDFQCGECFKTYKRRKTLLAHIRRVHAKRTAEDTDSSEEML